MSTFSSSSTRCANEMSGEYALVSASAPGSVIERRNWRMRLVRVADLEDLLDDGAVLALELARLHGRRVLVGPLLDLDAEAALGVVVRCADDGAVQAGEGDGAGAPGKPTRSTTSATVPTFAYSCSCRGTRRTRASSPVSTASVTVMPGNTTVSSSGTSNMSLTI